MEKNNIVSHLKFEFIIMTKHVHSLIYIYTVIIYIYTVRYA